MINYKQVNYTFPEYFSEDLKDFISKILVRNPD